jgi:predicted dehydrogenase/threonine dehydrogenase-like Zn-dependent dehydrogenase
MRAVVLHSATGRVTVEDLPAPLRQAGQVLLQNRYSLLSAGTERAVVERASRSLVAKLRERPDQVHKVLQKLREIGPAETAKLVRERLEPPDTVLGYSCAGVVIEQGSAGTGLVQGRLAAAAGAGYAVHAELVSVPANLCVPVPDGVSGAQAAFATVGAIALRGIHQARVEPGSRVAVVGLGLVGQLTARMLDAYGYDVVGIDLDEEMVARASAAGLRSLVRSRPDLVDEVRRGWGGHLADSVLLTAATASADPIELAGAMARDRASIVVVGDVSVRPERHAYYHKELEIRYSRSYGPGRYDPVFEEGGISYPEGFVAWDERRNLSEVLRLFSVGALEVETLSPLVVPIEEAARAYELLGDRSERRVAILLEYPERMREIGPVPVSRAATRGRQPTKAGGGVALGAVGAGSFATGVLFPILRDNPAVRLSWLATSKGITALNEARRWGFSSMASGLEEGLDTCETDGVLVLSRHDSHAVASSTLLRRGIPTFCEKPLALSEAELEEVAAAYLEGGGSAMVGFNRRFSPLLRRLKEAVEGKGPLQLTYRVFAGTLDPSHWYFDPVQGGRIHGEVCHFVDTLCFVVGSAPTLVTAVGADGHHDPISAQSITALLQFDNGSSATLLYAGHSPMGPPKELLEVAGRDVAGRIDDFRSLEVWSGGAVHHESVPVAAKGHREEMEAFVQLVSGNTPAATDFGLSLASTLTTCRLARSLTEAQAETTAPETPALKEVLSGAPSA